MAHTWASKFKCRIELCKNTFPVISMKKLSSFIYSLQSYTVNKYVNSIPVVSRDTDVFRHFWHYFSVIIRSIIAAPKFYFSCTKIKKQKTTKNKKQKNIPCKLECFYLCFWRMFINKVWISENSSPRNKILFWSRRCCAFPITYTHIYIHTYVFKKKQKQKPVELWPFSWSVILH